MEPNHTCPPVISFQSFTLTIHLSLPKGVAVVVVVVVVRFDHHVFPHIPPPLQQTLQRQEHRRRWREPNVVGDGAFQLKEELQHRSIVESLPVFKFGALCNQKDGLNRAICLTKFEVAEALRPLPKCKLWLGCEMEVLEEEGSDDDEEDNDLADEGLAVEGEDIVIVVRSSEGNNVCKTPCDQARVKKNCVCFLCSHRRELKNSVLDGTVFFASFVHMGKENQRIVGGYF
ncbi:RING-H2 finger protein ATL43 [Spatholobus suberectus]|nr:RING-H2 finger protein ATL43 [Spatholobus suberectus]